MSEIDENCFHCSQLSFNEDRLPMVRMQSAHVDQPCEAKSRAVGYPMEVVPGRISKTVSPAPPTKRDPKQSPAIGRMRPASAWNQQALLRSRNDSATRMGCHSGTGSPNALYSSLPIASLKRRSGSCVSWKNLTTYGSPSVEPIRFATAKLRRSGRLFCVVCGGDFRRSFEMARASEPKSRVSERMVVH